MKNVISEPTLDDDVFKPKVSCISCTNKGTAVKDNGDLLKPKWEDFVLFNEKTEKGQEVINQILSESDRGRDHSEQCQQSEEKKNHWLLSI